MQNAQPLPPEVQTPEVQKITDSALQLVDKFEHYAIQTDAQYQEAASELKRIKAALNEVEDQRLAITRPMDEAKKRVMTFFGQFSTRLGSAEQKVKGAMVEYLQQQERIQQEAARLERERAEREAAKLREAARKADEAAAEKERKRLAEEQRKAEERAQAEADRIAKEKAEAQAKADAEALRRAEENERAAQARRQAEQERLHQERLAAEAAARERTARAKILEERADMTQTAPVAPATPKIKGVSSSKVWDFEIIDESKIPDIYKIVDQKKIRGVVKALKADANIPGVRVFQKAQISSRSK